MEGIKFGYQTLQSKRYTQTAYGQPSERKKICLVNRHSPGIGLILLCSPLCSIHRGAIDLKRQKVDDYISKKENVTRRKKRASHKKILILILFHHSRYLCSVALLHVTCNLYICTPPIYLVQFRFERSRNEITS